MAVTATPNVTSSTLPHHRREKPQLSCTLCRKRKLKCDRGYPCETCVSRGLSLSCSYIRSNRALEKPSGNQPRSSAYQRFQDRIGQLEKLVASRVKDSSKTFPSEGLLSEPGDASDYPTSVADTAVDQKISMPVALEASARLGRMSVESTGTIWVETDHWTAILDGIGELKHCLDDTGDDNEYSTRSSDPPSTSGPQLLLGGREQVKRKQVLAAIPHRSIVDRLVSRFFMSVELAPMVLHTPTFLEEYERFWENPEQHSILWIGLLFGIMCLAELQQQFGFEITERNNADCMVLAQNYRTKISECLILGNYTKPARYTIETLLLYMHVEHLQSKDSETSLWMLLGITVRLALRMGYHRDASHFPRVSPFHAEMRRRVWCVLFTMDAGSAAQFGLPRMIRASQCSTAEPRNLLDDDIGETMHELPPARPDTIQTAVQYFVAKNRLISVYGKISDLKTLTQSPKYTEILRLDQVLLQTYESIPQSLAMREMSQSIMDDSKVIFQRVYVALIFHKARCILHRPYLTLAKTDTGYTTSRTACIEATLGILHIHQLVDQETQPGGRLYADRGKITATMKNDFLLATTILCVDFDDTISRSATFVSQNAMPRYGPSETVFKALHQAYSIWLRSIETSREARQAVRAMKIVLNKAPTLMTSSSSTSSTSVESIPIMDGGSGLDINGTPVIMAPEWDNPLDTTFEADGLAPPWYFPGDDEGFLLDLYPMDDAMDGQWILSELQIHQGQPLPDDRSNPLDWTELGA